MIDRLVLFGGTGDLSARYLLPGLAALRAAGHLGDRFELVCSDRSDWDAERFRSWVAARLDEYARAVSSEAKASIVSSARFQRADVTEPGDVASIVAGDEPVAVYLALPPALFPAAVSALDESDLPEGSRIVLEKPFGTDLDGAVELNRMLADLAPEEAVFRVDHFLAMTTVANVLGARLTNRVLESSWNSAHIEEVEIVWDEQLTLEGRAGYYDQTGALKDMVQNHLLQLLCLVAMEPPVSLGERDLRDRKVDVLRSVRRFTDQDILHRTRRARYAAGRLNGQDVPAYADEQGVDPGRGTESFTEIDVRIDNWRWSGTRFRLRTGKALGADRKEIIVRFRSVPDMPFGLGGGVPQNVLRFALEPEGLALDITGMDPRARSCVPLRLIAEMAQPELPPYGRVLLDVLAGNPAMSIRGDEAEESWRIVTPVLSAWSRGLVPLEEYPAGSDGPPPRESGA